MKALLASLILLVSFSAQSQIFQKTIHFENDEFIIDDDDKLIIAGIVDFINDETKIISAIEIYGFADSNASIKYNIDLSKKRATAVSEMLRAQLNSELNNKIVVSWYGEIKPDAIKKNLNYSSRSVDVIILYANAELKQDRIADLYRQLSTPVQQFLIDPLRDTVLKGNNGTLISISANSFYIPKMDEGKNVAITLQESYDIYSMFVNGLGTTSGNKLLESAGMIQLTAKIGSHEITLRDDKPVEVMFPAEQFEADMQLFYGEHDPKGQIDWQTANQMIQESSYYDRSGEVKRRRDFYTHRYTYKCPFFFCGMNQFFTGNYDPDSIPHYRFDRKGYAMYMDSMYAIYGVRDYFKLRKMMRGVTVTEIENKIGLTYVSTGEANYYLTKTTQLGWMNCDRFQKLKEDEKANVYVEQIQSPNVSVSMVFKGYKSIMMPNNTYGIPYGFYNVPVNDECFIVFLKFEKEVAYMSIQEISIQPELSVKPDFKAYTVEEMKKELEKLGV